MIQLLSLAAFSGLLFLELTQRIPERYDSIVLVVSAFLLSFSLTAAAIRLGRRYKIVDDPDNERKIHTVPVPLTGGLAITAAFGITIVANFHFSWEMKGVLLGSFIVFCAGFLDDLKDLSAKIRLVLQLLASGVLIYFGVRITFIPDWLGGIYTESLITTLWLVGITNSMNFLDGMDGLASGIAMIVSAFFAVFALRTGQGYLALLCLALTGSCLGFFFYNFRRKGAALVFLGDGGSNFLGFFLAAVAIMGDWGKNSSIDLVIPAVIMGVLIFDMTLTTIMRIHSGKVRNFSEWIHYTGKDHFHHRLTDMGFSSKGAVIMIFLTCLVSGFGALVMKGAEGVDTLYVVLQFISFFVLIAFLMIYKANAGKKE